MKVKNVIKGLLSQYNLEEINIISTDRILFSGKYENWKTPDLDMTLFKKQVENLEVMNKMIFNNRKAFIFVPEIDTYYPIT